MDKTLEFTTKSPRQIKQGDTETMFTFICKSAGSVVDLTQATNITAKIGNASGYLRSQPITITSLAGLNPGWINLQPMPTLIAGLPAGNYQLEIWVVDQAGTSIYPSDKPLGFTITNNIESESGASITTIAFDDFVKAMNKAASTIAKGDKGDPGEGLDIKGQVTSVSALPTTANEGDGYLVNEELYVYTSGAWKDCGPIQGPQGIQGKTGTGISSTTIQYQISNSATTSPTGTWSNSIVATTITNPYLWMKATLNYTDRTTKDFYLVSQKGDKGDKGDTPDLSNYTTVTDLNNGLSTKVTDNKNGTISVNGNSILPANEAIIGRIDGAYTDMNDIPMGWMYLNGWAESGLANWGLPQDFYYVHCFKKNYSPSATIQIAYGIGLNNTYVRTNYSTSWKTWKLLADDSKVLHLSTGDTASRPTGISAGYQYFDTSLNKPIWYTGKNWVDATGTTV
ncbi:hypothetical protein [Lactiplantibacillus plantarum]|uniref:hypothetical protein n=1 Tax=Lactiplantibacillus plantarum TaxID=1590 RepID=UPI0021CB771E|nr:hypothetical protein [Lactiplantibacillus plantarum]